MLPRSCYCLLRVQKGSLSLPRGRRYARPSGGGGAPGGTGRSSVSLTRWPQPLPGRGGPAPRDPPPPLGSSAATSRPRLRGRCFLLLVSAPTCPHTRSELTPDKSESPHWRGQRQPLQRRLALETRPPLPDQAAKSSVPAATAAPPQPRARVRRLVPGWGYRGRKTSQVGRSGSP